MASCRALTDNEVKLVREGFSGVYKRRNEMLFVLGIKAGFRISELLSLQVKDVMQYGKMVDRVEVSRRYMKSGKAGKASSRAVPLHPEARHAHYHGDLLKTQKALGHKNINSTIKSLALDEAEVDEGMLAA